MTANAIQRDHEFEAFELKGRNYTGDFTYDYERGRFEVVSASIIEEIDEDTFRMLGDDEAVTIAEAFLEHNSEAAQYLLAECEGMLADRYDESRYAY